MKFKCKLKVAGRMMLVALLLCCLSSKVAAATNTVYLKHWPAQGYGGVQLSGGTTNSTWFSQDRTVSSSTNQYLHAAEMCTGGTVTPMYRAFFLGFAKSEDDAKTCTLIPTDADEAGEGDAGGTARYAVSSVNGKDGNPITHRWRTRNDMATSSNWTYYAVFTMVKALAQVDSDETELDSWLNRSQTSIDEGSVSIVNNSKNSGESDLVVRVGDEITLVATAASGKEFKGWYLNGEKVSGETSYNFTASDTPCLYIAKFGDSNGDTDKYYYAQVHSYPNLGLGGGVYLNFDDDATPSVSDFSDTYKTPDGNVNDAVNLYAKDDGKGCFLGFAKSEELAKKGTYLTMTETNGMYKSSLLLDKSSTSATYDTENETDIYAVFSMVKASAVDSNGGSVMGASVSVSNSSDGDLNGTPIVCDGDNAVLTADISTSSTSLAFSGWRIAGTNAIVSLDNPLILNNVTSKVAYEGVFTDRRVIVITEASRADDGKCYVTIGNYSDTQYMTFPSELTVYTVRYGDTKSTTTVTSKGGEAPTDLKIYATEDARTISGITSTQSLTLDPIGDVTYSDLTFVGSTTNQNQYNYGSGNSHVLGHTNAIRYCESSGWITYTASSKEWSPSLPGSASSDNRQAVLVSGEPGTYTVTLTKSTTSSSLTSENDGYTTWPRYNRLSARDNAFTPNDLDSYDYYVLSKKNNHVAFYPVASGKVIPAGKGYIRVQKSTNSSKDYIDFLGNEGAVTGIESVTTATEDANAPAYNLSGQRVGNGYKGIVIVNGKKHVRK